MFWMEVVATLFGVLCVVLTIRRNIWCWPTGLVQVLLFIAIFYHARLYSDLLLHVIYVGLQFYGWYSWQTGAPAASGEGIRILRLDPRRLAAWLAITVAGTLSLGAAMARWTDASFPYGDAFTTVASLVAQFLLARRYLENWMFWIVVDIVAIGIYYQKDLLPTTLLYTLFLGLAITGLLAWRKQQMMQTTPAELLA